VRYNSSKGEGVKRIGPHILNGLTATSLVLCLATLWLWDRSYESRDFFGRWKLRGEPPLLWETYSGVVSDGGHLTVGTQAHFDIKSLWRLRRPVPPFERWGRVSDLSCLDGERAFQPLSPIVTWKAFGIRALDDGFLKSRPDAWRRRVRLLRVPHWYVVGLTAILPACALGPVFRRYRSWRRRRAGFCPSCGYDMSATPGRCPECGMIPRKPVL
jgi:hypothetical protein